MVNGDEWDDVGFENDVDQPLIEIESCLIDTARACGVYARPSDGHTVRLQAQVLHQGNIIGIAVVVVVRDITVFSIERRTGRVREAVPYRISRPIGEGRTLNLIRSGGSAPQKVFGKVSKVSLLHVYSGTAYFLTVMRISSSQPTLCRSRANAVQLLVIQPHPGEIDSV